MKSRDEIQAAIAAARGTQGFSAADDVTDAVMACCTGADADTVAACEAFARFDEVVGAAPLALIVQLALSLIPILFSEGGFTVEKMTAVLQLIASIFA